MKLLDIINEGYVNITNQDDKVKYADEIYNYIVTAYSTLPGGCNFKSVDDLLEDTGLWKLKFLNNKLIAGRLYKDKSGLNKSIAAFTNGTTEGKTALYKIIEEDVKRGRSYSEVSGKMEHILIYKFNAVPISSKYVPDILNKEITPSSDGYHYTRKIGGIPHEKILVSGDPNMFLKMNIDVLTRDK